ncbi:MAG: sodium:proton antiporter [Alicyclobacillus sp.]|nr:sodium:proton antiporter [Alicyclobacillus sp.]
MAGLLVGAYMQHPTVLGGIDGALAYLVKELAVPDNLRLVVFLYGFGAFVGLVRVTGGVSGFAQWMAERVHSVRGAFAVTWVSSLVTFMAPDFRIITVAPVMRRIFERLRVPAERVAFTIDATSTPVCALVPIGTAFVGYMVGLIATSARHQVLPGSPYHLYLLSIPLNFFSWLILAYALVISFRASPAAEVREAAERKAEDRRVREQARAGVIPFPRPARLSAETRLKMASQFAKAEFGEEPVPDVRAGRARDGATEAGVNPDATGGGPRDGQKGGGPGTGERIEPPDPVEFVSEHIPPRLANLAIPLALLLILTLFLTWWDGRGKAPTLWGALAQANAAKAMLEALLITLLVAFVWYTVQRVPVERTVFGVLAGGNEMMGVIVLLALVWAVSAVSTDLGFADYVERAIGRTVPPAFVAPALFLFGCAISYVIGSSFGTWGMLLPLGFSLAASTHTPLPLIAGAVFASGTFGGFASPLSDNTVAMATVMKLSVMDYARHKLKPALWAVGGSALLYGIAGWVVS